MAKIALIGPDQQDNLPLRYLAASLESAGHEAELIRFNNKDDTNTCTEQIVKNNPDVIGLGISFQFAVNDYLHLASVIRKAGFDGHITCGGHVPTFCYENILKDCSAIDTVVRHEGEHTLNELVETLENSKQLKGIKGLVYRSEGGIVVEPPRPTIKDLDILPRPKLRNPGPFSVGGVPVAFVITARGCFGACTYCSIQSFGRDAGGPLLRLRQVESVADEIADHYHQCDIRTFFFQDDLFVLPNRQRTLRRMHEMSAALQRRGLDTPVFWVKGRPESITQDIAKTARELGVVHMFLGVENASDQRLMYLGRTHQHFHNIEAIRNCEENGIRPSFNLMLFDPDCSVEDVATTIDFAETVHHLPWNVCRTEIYSGTPLLRALEAENRLTGDYRNFGYEMRDPVCEIMFRILRVSFHERAFAVSSLLNKLISISFARQAHEAFFPGEATDNISRSVDDLLSEAHLDTVKELRIALDFSLTHHHKTAAEIQDFAVKSAVRINHNNRYFYTKFRELWVLLNARGAALYQRLQKNKSKTG